MARVSVCVHVGGLEKRREGGWGFGWGMNEVLCSSAHRDIYACTHTYMYIRLDDHKTVMDL